MKCIHYHICVNSFNLLCSDAKCSLVKQEQKKEDHVRLEAVRQMLDEYKRNEGIASFLDRNLNKEC
jgi:hypothetical protein